MEKDKKYQIKEPKALIPQVDIGKDLIYKKDFNINSWFAIGHFESEGHTLDFLYHLMAMSYGIPGVPDVIVSCLSVTDETDGLYYGDTQVYPLEMAQLSEEEFFIKLPDGELKGDLNKIYLHACLPDREVEVEMVPMGYPIYNCGTGNFPLQGMNVYQYSLPTIETKGKLRIQDKVYEISGRTWFDRQWENAISNSFLQWGWMDLNLDNGDYLSLWFTIEDGKETSWATVLHPDGTHAIVYVEPMLQNAGDYWKSEVSQFEYPTSWKVNIPDLNAQLEVLSTPKEQELASKVNVGLSHYEGASTISGVYRGQKVKGYCCVELTGGNWRNNH